MTKCIQHVILKCLSRIGRGHFCIQSFKVVEEYITIAARTKRYSRSTTPTQAVNEEIRAPKVRLIRENGEQVGIVSIEEARTMARDAGLDLVEVSPNTDPPVCRLMDFGKFMYNKSKRERQARKAQAKTEVKEIWLRPKTGAHDVDFKVRDARKWLESGDKVKVRIKFRGRELAHPDVAKARLDEIAEKLSDVGVIEQKAGFEGRSMLMILAPTKSKS